jgi:predicted branched-subunit amino acid permease
VGEGCAGAVVVTGGTEAWSAAGLAVTRGARRAIGLERQVRIGAGALVVLGVVLARVAHPDFVWLAAFVGAGLVFAGVTGFCGMGLLLAKAPWNRG